jgi:hypothetical protein
MLREADVQELLDRAHIADAIYAYCDYVDDGDVDAVVDLFATTGTLDLGGGAVHRGRTELRELFLDRFQLYTTTSFHSGGVRFVSYTPTVVRTSTYLYGIHDAKDADMQMHLWGRFEDELVNQFGTWLFRHRHLRVAGLSHQAPAEVPRRFNRITHAPQPEPVDEPVLRVLPHTDSVRDSGGVRR